MSDYSMERGLSREQKWAWAEQMDKFRTVRTGSGQKYRVRMTAEEIEGRRQLGLGLTMAAFVPACIAILAWAAGLIG